MWKEHQNDTILNIFRKDAEGNLELSETVEVNPPSLVDICNLKHDWDQCVAEVKAKNPDYEVGDVTDALRAKGYEIRNLDALGYVVEVTC